MRIDIFHNNEFSNVFIRDLKRARSKTCPLSSNENYGRFEEVLEDVSSGYRIKYHAESVLSARTLETRNHKALSNAVNDTHNEIEKLGYQSYFDSYCVLLALENRLDLVLNLCCGADPANVRKIPNYDFISFKILNVCPQVEDNIYLRNFKGYDLNLDKYIESCFMLEKEDLETTGESVLVRFFSGILDSAATILTTVAYNIYKPLHLSLRSQGFSNFVFGALSEKRTIPDVIECVIEDRIFDLPLHVLKRGEYFKLVLEGDPL